MAAVLLFNRPVDWIPPRHTKMGEFLEVRPMLEKAGETIVSFKGRSNNTPQRLRAAASKRLA
jgi:hypothetical protein